jgi:hypothetical protein
MIGGRQRFTLLQRLLHWLMAVCILAMLFIGVGMVGTLPRSRLGVSGTSGSNPLSSSEESANHWFLLRQKAFSLADSSEPQQRSGKGEEALVTLCEPC